MLYLSTVYQNPNSSTPNTASSHNQQNNDIQVTLTNVRRGQTVYVAVDSNGLNESYTIRMNEVLNGPTVVPSLLTLLDGIPQVRIHALDHSDSYNEHKNIFTIYNIMCIQLLFSFSAGGQY